MVIIVSIVFISSLGIYNSGWGSIIEVKGSGGLRNNKLELLRALEVAEIVLHLEPGSDGEWTLRYGEIPIGPYRVDALMVIQDGEGARRIGIEVVSSGDDVDKARIRLRDLIDLGEIDKGYIYIRSLSGVHDDVSEKARLAVGVV